MSLPWLLAGLSQNMRGCAGCSGFQHADLLQKALGGGHYAKPVQPWLIVSKASLTATVFPAGSVSLITAVSLTCSRSEHRVYVPAPGLIREKQSQKNKSFTGWHLGTSN